MKTRIDPYDYLEIILLGVAARRLELELGQLEIEKRLIEQAKKSEQDDSPYKAYVDNGPVRGWNISERWKRNGYLIHQNKLQRYETELSNINKILACVQQEYTKASKNFADQLAKHNSQLDAANIYNEAKQNDSASFLNRKNFYKNIHTELSKHFEHGAVVFTIFGEINYSRYVSSIKAPSLFKVKNRALMEMLGLSASIFPLILGASVFLGTLLLVATSALFPPLPFIIAGTVGLVMAGFGCVKMMSQYFDMVDRSNRINAGGKLLLANVGGGSTSELSLVSRPGSSVAPVSATPPSATAAPSNANDSNPTIQPAPSAVKNRP